MQNLIVEKIYEYDNYRFFLRDYFKEQKRLKSIFSHRYFAKRAGFSSSSFCSHIIDGKRQLTENSLKKILKGLGIRGRRATYFHNLVMYNQAVTVEERELYFRKLDRIRKNTEFYTVKKKQYAYYDKWYYPVIRELAVYGNWNGNYTKLASMVTPPIQPEKARKAVDALVEIGMLLKREDGSYTQPHEAVTAKDVPPVVTRKTRRDYIHLAEEAMEKLPIEERHISGVTVLMSKEKFKEVTEKLDEIRRSILSESLDENIKNRVYQFNFQAFPLSKDVMNLRKRSNKEEGGNE